MVQYRTKKASYPKCPVTGQRLPGIKAVRPQEYSNKRMSKRQKCVNRIYGGCLSHNVVRERIMRAFLVEEQKIVKKVRFLTILVHANHKIAILCSSSTQPFMRTNHRGRALFSISLGSFFVSCTSLGFIRLIYHHGMG